MNSKTKFINLHGGPGLGKSTTAAGVFYKMKTMGINVELIPEYPKEVVWEGLMALLNNQVHIFSEQLRRQWRLLDQVDYAVTDSPLLLSSVYFDHYLLAQKPEQVRFSPDHINLTRKFFEETFMQFNNIDFVIERRFKEIDGQIVYYDYKSEGRYQKIEDALVIDKKVSDRLYKYNPGYMTVRGDNVADTIVATVTADIT